MLQSRRAQRLSDDLNRARFHETGLGTLGLEPGAGLYVPLVFRTETPGVLAALHAPEEGDFSEEDERLLTSFATSAASAVVTARAVTKEQLLAREAATEDERRRWARELHDETLQGLGALRLSLAAARKTTEPEAWRTALDDAIAELDTEIANVRGIIADVRPAGSMSSARDPRSRRSPIASEPAASTSRSPSISTTSQAVPPRGTRTSSRRRSTGSPRRP